MSSSHTPGPWQADRRCILAPTPERGLLRCVAEVWSGACDTLAEADANERLIAAAPELLDALVRLERLHRGVDAWHEDAQPQAWAAARRAIAIALGAADDGGGA